MIMHFRPMTRLRLAVAEVETFADLDCSELRRVIAHRRRHRTARTFRRLETDDVEQCTLAARHLTVRQAAVGPFEVLEAGDAFHHLLAREIKSRKLLHGTLLVS